MKKGWKRGYKVLETSDGILRSLYRHPKRDAGIYFSLNEVIKPRTGCGPITVLKNLKAAKFLVSRAGIPIAPKIFPCEYLPSRESWVWDPQSKSHLEELERRNTDILLPGSTALAQEVILRSPKTAKKKASGGEKS